MWKDTRLAQLANRVIEIKNEQPKGFSSLVRKKKMTWKRTRYTIDVRFISENDIKKDDTIKLVFSRKEIFTMVSRFKKTMKDDKFLEEISKLSSE